MDCPRVTEILRPFTSYDKVPRDILHKAATRGTAVHALCAAIAKGAWLPDNMIDEELRGYVKSFKLWQDLFVKDFILIEKRYTSDEFTGQLDFVIMGKDNEKYLVDLKTSSQPQKTYPIQMAAYDSLLKSNKITVNGAILVYLDKTGEFPKTHVIDDMTEETQIFLSALKCWKYFNKRKRNVKN